MLTQERLKEVLHYDPETGIFTWVKPSSNRLKPGDLAGSIEPDGYRKIMVDNKNYKANRLAWLYMTGVFPEHEIDHRNTCRSDDSFFNLRHATHSQNAQNASIRTDNTSGIKGVFWHKYSASWVARLQSNGKQKCVGYFISKEEAGNALHEARERLHGEFANHG